MVTDEEMQNMSHEELAELQRSNCIFCKIIAGQIPSNKVYEDDKVLAILDIRPSKKGHIIVMPKEHFAILTLVKPEIFNHMFVTCKILSEAVKRTTLCQGFSIFIANGGVAGQIAPHFLFHLIPRDKNDNLSVLDPKENISLIEENNSIFNALKNNIGIMMNNYLKSENIVFADFEKEKENSVERRKESISKIIEENKEVRDMIINEPEDFKKLISQNPEIKNIFQGVDINKLSEQLSKIALENTSNARNTDIDSSQPIKKPEVFLGENPLEQKNKVFKYFEEKPKAKELFLNDLETFKELLSKREDIQEIFKDVNLEKLNEKLKESIKIKGDEK